jgi:hypothetical protein
MTPILGAASGSSEEYYTNQHCQVRNTVERCIGVLKARWRCLLAHRVLHYDPITCGQIVNACVVLHNIANACSTPSPELVVSEINSEQQRQQDDVENIANVEVTDNARNVLVNRLWRSR